MNAIRALLAAVLWLQMASAWAQTNEADAEKPAASSDAAPSDAAAVEDILNRVEKTLQALPAYACDMNVVINVRMPGMKNEMASEYEVRIERPRKWAIVQKSGTMGGTSISDGKQVTNYLPMVSRYVVEPLPEGEDLGQAVAEGPMALLGPAAYLPAFMGKDFTKTVMEGVTEAKLEGEEQIDGQPCWHCTFEQEGLSWELWILQGDRPLPRRAKARPDLSAQAEQAPDQVKEMSMDVTIEFTDWNLEPKFTKEDFSFDPPKDAEKVDSLFEGLGGSDEPHALLGEPAPTFELETLDGETFKLEDELGKKVIMLDFWATWCGPCVQALPEVTAAAEEMRDKGVVFYAINLQEEADEVRKFFKDKELEAPVLLDGKGEVGQQYQANAIPQTVLIGKDGRVQVVHIGFGGDAKKQLIEELKALADGKDLATEALKEYEAKKAADEQEANLPVEAKGLVKEWSQEGAFHSVAVDKTSDELYALKRFDAITHYDATGKELSKVAGKADATSLRLANLTGDASPEFLLFTQWSSDLIALDRDGEQLWEYPSGQGLDDVAAADLDEDGVDEVIVGFNGSTGLHVLGSDGEPKWKNTSLGNVWHVSAGQFTSREGIDELSTSAAGQLHVFDRAEGELVESFDVKIYATVVRAAPSDGGKVGRAVVAGSAEDGEAIAMVDGNGEIIWTAELPGKGHIESLAVDATGAYVAYGQSGGLVGVLNAENGETLGHVGGLGDQPEVAMLTIKDERPLVLVADGQQLTAFKLQPDVPPETEPESANLEAEKSESEPE